MTFTRKLNGINPVTLVTLKVILFSALLPSLLQESIFLLLAFVDAFCFRTKLETHHSLGGEFTAKSS